MMRTLIPRSSLRIIIYIIHLDRVLHVVIGEGLNVRSDITRLRLAIGPVLTRCL